MELGQFFSEYFDFLCQYHSTHFLWSSIFKVTLKKERDKRAKPADFATKVRLFRRPWNIRKGGVIWADVVITGFWQYFIFSKPQSFTIIQEHSELEHRLDETVSSYSKVIQSDRYYTEGAECGLCRRGPQIYICSDLPMTQSLTLYV
jgi:hypothetical protein